MPNPVMLEPSGYDALLEAQGGGCRVCGEPPPSMLNGDGTRRMLHPDFVNGVIAALLCWSCVVALSNFGRDALKLRAALEYLEQRAS